MKIIFLGTPDFAVPILEALHASRHSVVAVVTQPDRPKGRSLALTPPAVKKKAEELGLPVFQPEKVSNPDFLRALRQLSPDMAVVAAFGQIFKKELLELPRLGCWNVHASILPRYRGASPIVRAILAGEKESGATIMKMGPGIDDGPILEHVKIAIPQNMTAGELEEQIASSGARLMVSLLEKIKSGNFHLTEQNPHLATSAPKLKKEEALINWRKDAIKIHNQIRALNPQPGAYTLWRGERLKLWQSEPVSVKTGRPGEVLRVEKELLWVGAGSDALSIQKLQLPGKRAIGIAEFLAGTLLKVGDSFGDVAPSV